jgi:lipoteichoic acid synthase
MGEFMMRVWNWLQQHWRWFILPFVCGGLYFYEQNSAWNFYKSVSPFPEEEYWFRIADSLLRDLILLLIAFILYFRRNRLPDRARRYEPVVVIGILYLAFMAYMMNTLKMDHGTLTTLAILAGLNNNILLVLLAAMFYHRTPTGIMKKVYFVIYLLSALIIFGDAVYFWQTSMHIQSILFRNFNIYAIQGVLTSFSWKFGLGFLVFVVALILLFRVPQITRHKPNFVWSLMCVAAFTIVLNLVYNSCRQLNVVTYHAIGLWNEEQVEKSKNEYQGYASYGYCS